MGSRSRIKCHHCKRRIRNHEPDLVLEDLEDDRGRPRFFHSMCGAAAYAAAARKPALYRLTVRNVEGVLS